MADRAFDQVDAALAESVLAGGVDDHHVVAVAAEHGVDAGAAVDQVVAALAANRVVAAAAEQRVRTAGAGDDIGEVIAEAGGIAGEEQVLDIGGELERPIRPRQADRVVALVRILENLVSRSVGIIEVVALASVHAVIAAEPVEHVVAVEPVKDVARMRAGDLDPLEIGEGDFLIRAGPRVDQAGIAVVPDGADVDPQRIMAGAAVDRILDLVEPFFLIGHVHRTPEEGDVVVAALGVDRFAAGVATRLAADRDLVRAFGAFDRHDDSFKCVWGAGRPL